MAVVGCVCVWERETFDLGLNAMPCGRAYRNGDGLDSRPAPLPCSGGRAGTSTETVLSLALKAPWHNTESHLLLPLPLDFAASTTDENRDGNRILTNKPEAADHLQKVHW